MPSVELMSVPGIFLKNKNVEDAQPGKGTPESDFSFTYNSPQHFYN